MLTDILLNESRQPVNRRLLRLPPKANAVKSPLPLESSRTQRSASLNLPMRRTMASSVHCMRTPQAARRHSA